MIKFPVVPGAPADGNDTSTRQNLHLVRARDWRDARTYVESIVHIRGPEGSIFEHM